MNNPMTQSEVDARAIMAGDEAAIKEFQFLINTGQKKYILQVLFAMRHMYRVEGRNAKLGELMVGFMQNPPPFFDGSLYGSMFAVLALNNPSMIGRVSTFFTNNTDAQLLITESLLMLRDALTDPNER